MHAAAKRETTDILVMELAIRLKAQRFDYARSSRTRGTARMDENAGHMLEYVLISRQQHRPGGHFRHEPVVVVVVCIIDLRPIERERDGGTPVWCRGRERETTGISSFYSVRCLLVLIYDLPTNTVT
jgi:hypothetical protein